MDKLLKFKEYILDKYPKTKKNWAEKRSANMISIDQLLFEIDQFNNRALAETSNENSALPIPDVSNLAKFCTEISKQEDCPAEFVEIVNREFWNII